MRTTTILTITSAALAATLLHSPISAQAQPAPVLKEGWCPTGYYTSGKYCVPTERAGHAVLKDGWCPTGYYTSGDYCVAPRANKTMAIPKSGWCPSGWYTSGKYCVKRYDQ